jgi:hypothetical protein
MPDSTQTVRHPTALPADDDVTSTYLRPFLNYNLGGGLSAGVGVEPSANWEADSHNLSPMRRT